MLQMLHDDIPVFLQYCKRNEQMKVAAQIIRPQRLPQSKGISPFEFPLVPDEQHTEEEEEVGGVGGLKVQVELWVHELDEMIEGQELGAHAGLVAEEVSFLDSELEQIRQ